MASDRAQILITAVDQTKSALASVKGNLEGLSVAASKVNGVLAGLGAALSLGALVTAGKAAIDTADDLSKLSQKAGISVESLSLLKPVAEQAGSSLQGLAKGLQKLATSMYDAAGGLREPKEAFDQLGVAFRDSTGQLRFQVTRDVPGVVTVRGTLDGETLRSNQAGALGTELTVQGEFLQVMTVALPLPGVYLVSFPITPADSRQTFTDFNLLPAPLRAINARGELEDSGQPVLGGCVGHNARVGSGMVIMPSRVIESDSILVASPERRVIAKNISYEESDHHKLRPPIARLHKRRYPRNAESEAAYLEEWE